MHPSFRKLLEEIEIQRKKTLDSVKHLTPEQLNSAPAGKWSIAEILSHLIAAEKLSLQYIHKKAQGIKEAADTGFREEVKMILLQLSQRIPVFKFKAPRQVVELTRQFQDVESMTKEWDVLREDLRQLLETIPDEFVNRKIYKHVRVGYLNMKHALKFFREHIIHHTPQIKKLL